MSSDHNDTAGDKPQAVGDSKQPVAVGEPTPVDRIAAELAALGESPLDDDDAALHNADADGEVATVSTLVSLSRELPTAVVRPLSELQLARVYRRVAMRMGAAARAVGSRPESEPPMANVAPTSRRSLLTALTVVAAAAAFVLVPALRSGDPRIDAAERRDALSAAQATGEAARAGLSHLGPSGGARATALAERYHARMRGGPQ